MHLGIDIGGTNVKGVLIKDDQIINMITRDTQRQDENWHDSIAGVYRELTQMTAESIESIGLSAPGVANENNRCIAFMPERFKGLEGFVWGELLGRDVLVLNDAHAALWAEAKWGEGKNFNNIVMRVEILIDRPPRELPIAAYNMQLVRQAKVKGSHLSVDLLEKACNRSHRLIDCCSGKT